VLRIAMRLEVVPDAQLIERVRAGMATGAPPDFVIGDEAHGPLLQRLDYGTDFIRL
jgi:ABC-type glycerol-3-phosphate transport system substrate-binding protein